MYLESCVPDSGISFCNLSFISLISSSSSLSIIGIFLLFFNNGILSFDGSEQNYF